MQPAYPEVRGLARGLTLLKALNRCSGGFATTGELASMTGLHRTTVKRLLETLRAEGMVRLGEREGQYFLTFEVKGLSEGVEDEQWVTRVARPAMYEALRDLLWPCDLATVDAGFMVVRESTHRWSNLSQHRAMIGRRMPLFVTALGRAYMAGCAEEELTAALSILKERKDWIGATARDRVLVARLVHEVVSRGYALNDGEFQKELHFSAVAVPLVNGSRILGAVNMIFPKDVISPELLREKYVPRLKALAHKIGKESEPWIGG